MEEVEVLCAFTIENRRVEVGDPVEVLPRVRIAGEYTQEGFGIPRRTQRRRAVKARLAKRLRATPAVSTSALPRSPVWYPPTPLLSLNPARRAGEREFPAPSRRRGNGAAPRRSRTWSPR